MTFYDMILRALSETKSAMTTTEIWEYAQLNIPEFITSGKTPRDTIAATIYVDIKEKKESVFVKTSTKPTRFILKKFYKQDNNSKVVEYKEPCHIKSNYDECDLHPLLTTFVYNNPDYNCHTKTINASKSTKQQKGKNEWLHPDIVGVSFIFDNSNDDNFIELYKNSNDNLFKLYSFELKKDLSFENLRRYYFQALSNSAWANEGYLVVMEIKDQEELLKDFARLNNAFGIGLIQLDNKDLTNSKTLFTSKLKQELDWDTISILAEENKDMKSFINKVNLDIKNSCVLTDNKKPETHYDKVLPPAELDNYILKFQ